MTDNVVWLRTNYNPPPREQYRGPRINRKRRKIAIQTILDEFNPQGVRACMIIGIPYEEDRNYVVSQCGGEPNEWRIALDDLHDLMKFPPDEEYE